MDKSEIPTSVTEPDEKKTGCGFLEIFAITAVLGIAIMVVVQVLFG